MATRLVSVVFDVLDLQSMSSWWAAVLAWEVVFEADDEVELSSGDPALPVLTFGAVPEPKVVKNRVHLDLSSSSVEEQSSIVARLTTAGARPVDVGQADQPWTVLADPEGNELCVLEPRDRYPGGGSLVAVVMDVADPEAVAPFWVAATGWTVAEASPEGVSLRLPGGGPPDLELLRVADPKVLKNRVHLDVAPFAGDDRDTEVDRLLALGGRRIDVGQGPEVTWVVLADPEGNELCVLGPR